ncbi:hypothetical protein ACEWY4_014130 [Coilia grayii]|uniref:Uncharacterized protein n=1 Tax=Coilia grayii TaxID=363190 RepID=A0ABD1JRE3_9TELE
MFPYKLPHHPHSTSNLGPEGCLPEWDSVVCWQAAMVGETVQLPCPAFFSLFSNGTGTISRNCSSSGWSRPFPPYHEACSVEDDIPEVRVDAAAADDDDDDDNDNDDDDDDDDDDYDDNDNDDDDDDDDDDYDDYDDNDLSGTESYFATVKLIYSVGYGASLVSLSIAVVILLVFRGLHCARNYIHIQLFFTFILKSVGVFIKDATLFRDDMDHCSLSTAACKAVVVFCHYCVMCNFSWLLVEALYINCLLLVAVPRSRRCLWAFSMLGWGEPSNWTFVLVVTVW